MTGCIFWNGRAIAFGPGDSVATALMRSGVRSLGPRQSGGHYSVFCGIGQCQGCLVRDADGQALESCLRPCIDGCRYHSIMESEQPDV